MANLLRLRAPTDIIYRERALANTDNPAAIPLTVCQSLSTRNLSSFVSIVSIDSDTFILVNFFILIRRKKSTGHDRCEIFLVSSLRFFHESARVNNGKEIW